MQEETREFLEPKFAEGSQWDEYGIYMEEMAWGKTPIVSLERKAMLKGQIR